MTIPGAYQSCVAMGSATLAGLAFGEVADRFAPVSGGWFLIVAAASVGCLALAAFGKDEPVQHCRVGPSAPDVCIGLALLAVFMVWCDAYRAYSEFPFGLQYVSLLPFLTCTGLLVKRQAWLGACGSAGFFATAVAILFANRGGGWVGFFGVYCT